MALTGLEIFKLLPKTNCKKCGRPTCLAFAMQLAQKKASLDDCPDVSAEAKNVLGAASAPPIKLVTLKAGEKIFKVGEETGNLEEILPDVVYLCSQDRRETP